MSKRMYRLLVALAISVAGVGLFAAASQAVGGAGPVETNVTSAASAVNTIEVSPVPPAPKHAPRVVVAPVRPAAVHAAPPVVAP